MFGVVGSSGTVKNVTLTAVNVTGYDYVGGIVGYNYGTVENCTVSGSVRGTGEEACVGAVVGDNDDPPGSHDNNYTGDLDLNLIGGDGGDYPDYPTATGTFVTTANGNVQYVDNDSGKVLFELSGAKDLIAYNVQFNTVGLFAANFDGNEISVVSNDGGYIFYLLDDLSGKTFVANGNNVVVYGDGVTVDVTTGDNVIELGETNSFNVTGFGAGDVIKLYDEAVQYGVSILGIESDGDGGATINLIGDGEQYSITVGGLNVGSAGAWTFDEDNQTAKIVGGNAELVGGQIVGKAAGTQFEVSGVTTSNDFEIYAAEDWKGVGLNAAAFTSNVKVESNDGGYDIVLWGELNGIDSATFTANEGNDNISNYVSGVLIDGGAGDAYIENWNGVTASVKGGAGADKFAYNGGEMTITDYVDGTDKIVTGWGVSISDEVEVVGNDVVFTTSYPGNTFSGKIVVKGAANLSKLTLYDYYDNTKTYTIPVTNEFNAAGTAVTVGGTAGDFSANSALYSITAAQHDSHIVANAKNNTIIISGGNENLLTGGAGNDTFKFESGGGLVTDYGIGATKDGSGKTLTNASGTDIVKVDGKVKGIYFDRDASSKKLDKFTATIVYNDGGDDQVVVLKDIAKKPTKVSATAPVYQTNDVAAATLKIWDTSNTKQAVISATNLKKLFHDDNDDAFTSIIKEKTDYLVDISEGETPDSNPFIAPSSNNDGNYSGSEGSGED